MFKNPFSFSGRIRRTEYGLSFIIYFIAAMLLQGVVVYSAGSGSSSSLLMLVFYIPLLWFQLAQAVKRSHDIGNSGWFVLIPFYALWLLFADGKPHPNKWGDDPKGRGNLMDNFLVEPKA